MSNIDNNTWEYDPVKELKGGVEAGKVVWSTVSLNAALDAIKKGLPLKSNPFCGTNTKLLKPDLVYKRTSEELEEYIKCMEDPVYFAEKCYFMTPEGLQRVKMRDYQIDYLRSLQHNRFNILLAARQSAKSTTTAVFALWKILFNVDKNGLILSKSAKAGQDLIQKVKDMYLYLPYYLKCGTMKWNQTSISFDNNSTLSTEAFSPTAGVGSTLNLVILDEFAWCPPAEVKQFYENVIPTVTTISDSNVCIMSTQNGFNLFQEIWTAAVTGKNIYHPTKIDWWQVPNWNPNTKQWEKRTEEWKNTMVGVLGSEEAFYYQYGTMFATSDRCLISREKMTKIKKNEILFQNNSELTVTIPNPEAFYVKPDYDISKFKTHNYMMLVDLAEGGGGDYTIFNIFEIMEDQSFEQVAYFRSNIIDLEHAALNFWLMVPQLFTIENLLVSIEWNTYGALFYNYILNYNEKEYCAEYLWRFTYVNELDLSCVVRYKKGDSAEDLAGLNVKFNGKMIPGFRFSSSSKITACSLLKILLEKEIVKLYDLIQISELETFEDKNGSGSYKASNGHDDMMMTLCQIPMLQQSVKWKAFLEELNERKVMIENTNNTNSLFNDIGNWSTFSSGIY